MSKVKLLDFFRTVPLFADQDPRSLEFLARVSQRKKLSKGQFLFLQDDPGDAAYVVCGGSIGIVRTTLDGRELVINEMRTGEIFGELALLQAGPRAAGAFALEESEVIRIPREEFLEKVESEPSLMRQLLETIAVRLRESSERESALAFLDVPKRLARFLLQHAEGELPKGSITLSQEEIAQFLGVARQTVAKILGTWRRAGWIVTGRGKIKLVDFEALEREAAEG